MEPSPERPSAPLESALYDLLTALKTPAPSASETESLCACAICNLSNRSVERWLRTFLSEYVNDPEARETLRRAQGFCAQHTSVLRNLNEALGIAILYADLARLARERWQEKTPGRAIIPFWQRLHPGSRARIAPCPACIAQQEATIRYVQALASGLDNPNAQNEVWSALETNPGLCAPHIEQIAAYATPPSAARLLQMESERLTALQAELERIIRNNDYRYRSEAWGEEKDAWKRALDKLRR